MKWRDLFKSNAPRGKPDPRVRWFGKLPTYADYYSSSTDEAWAVEFNSWIMEGYAAYVRREQSHGPARLPTATCILRLPKSAMTVFASFQDFGGDMRGRPFPLAFYVGLPTPMWPGPASDRLVPALRLLRDLAALREQVLHFFKAPGRFEAVFGGRECDQSGIDGETTDDSWSEPARALCLTDWFTGARACLGFDDVRAWLPALSAWGERIAQQTDEEVGPTLRFPIVMSLPTEPQVVGWVRWLEQRLELSWRFLSLIITHEPGAATGSLSVVARDPLPEDFLLLTPAAARLASVDDVCRLGHPPEARPVPGGQAPSAVEPAAVAAAQGPEVQIPPTWADFVNLGRSVQSGC